MPSYVNNDMLNQLKSDVIHDGIYHDSFQMLKQVLIAIAPASTGLCDADLEKVVHAMHNKGTKACLDDSLDDVGMVIANGKKEAEKCLRNCGVPGDKVAQVVEKWYEKWYDKVFTCHELSPHELLIQTTWQVLKLHIETIVNARGNSDKPMLCGAVMSYWDNTECPCLLDKQKDTQKEQVVVAFLNSVCNIYVASSWVDIHMCVL